MAKSYREQYDEAISQATPEAASAWLESEIDRYYVDHADVTKDKSRDEIAAVIKSNLGYMAGYGTDEDAKKIYALYGAVHPIFGTATYHDLATNTVFQSGFEFAKRLLTESVQIGVEKSAADVEEKSGIKDPEAAAV